MKIETVKLLCYSKVNKDRVKTMAKSRLFNIRLREEEWEIFDQIAAETGLNYAQIVRQRVFKEGDVVSEKLDNIELTLEEIKSAVCDK